jgi:hypothetical protein
VALRRSWLGVVRFVISLSDTILYGGDASRDEH